MVTVGRVPTVVVVLTQVRVVRQVTLGTVSVQEEVVEVREPTSLVELVPLVLSSSSGLTNGTTASRDSTNGMGEV